MLSDTHEPGTVKIRYRGLHRFCSWLVDEGELDSNPMATLSPPTLKMKPVPVITDEELAALLKACAGKEFADRRDEALIRLLLDCGVRISEACGLRLDQLDLDQGMAIVKGKGSQGSAGLFRRSYRTRARPVCADAPSSSLGAPGCSVPDPAWRPVTGWR